MGLALSGRSAYKMKFGLPTDLGLWMHRIFISALTLLFITGCVSPPPSMLWVRTDGRSGNGNPALEQQIAVDKTVCNGESQRANLSAGTNPYGGIVARAVEESRRQSAAGGVFEGCMATKGYVLVPADKAQATAEAFAATNKEREKLASKNPGS